MRASTSYLTKYISWAGLNVSLALFGQITGTFKFKKMMSYSDRLETEGSQYRQSRVRCNPSQASQAAALWLLVFLFWLPAKSGYSSPDRCALLSWDTCIHRKSTLEATTSRTHHLNTPLWASFSSCESKVLPSPFSLPPLLESATSEQDPAHTVQSWIHTPTNNGVLGCCIKHSTK